MERFATAAGLLPEQVWDAPDRPEARMQLGRPTGAAMPLRWAHAEYIKLLRSVHDGQVFDRIPAVVERYQGIRAHLPIEVWSFRRRVRSVRAGTILRVQARSPFTLHWTTTEWSAVTDTDSRPTALEIDFVDIPVAAGQTAPIRFTFFWRETRRWEGRDFEINVAS
jgi:glucoamylase